VSGEHFGRFFAKLVLDSDQNTCGGEAGWTFQLSSKKQKVGQQKLASNQSRPRATVLTGCCLCTALLLMSFITNWLSGVEATYGQNEPNDDEDWDDDDDVLIPRRYYPLPTDHDTTTSTTTTPTPDEDFETSRLFVGLWECADQERLGTTASEQAQVDALSKHVRNGLTTIDAADHYGKSETIVSKFLTQYGAESVVEICTKFCPKPGPMTFDLVEQAIRVSRDRLFPANMTDLGKVIDVLHFHWWDYSDTRYIDALVHLATLQDRGWIKHIALTNFDAAHLRIVVASGLHVLWNQVHCSLLDSRSANSMTTTCLSLAALQTEPCKLVVYGALAGGFLTDRWLGVAEPRMEEDDGRGMTMMQKKYKRFIDVWGGWGLFQELLGNLSAIAHDINIKFVTLSPEERRRLGSGEGDDHYLLNIANVALKYVEQLSHVSAVIVGARLGERDHVSEQGKGRGGEGR